MSHRIPRKLALLVIAPVVLNSPFLGVGFTSLQPCHSRAFRWNMRRCHLTRFAAAAFSRHGFADYTDALRDLAPERRLQHVAGLTEGEFCNLADKLTKTREGVPQCLLHAIKLAAKHIGIVIVGVDKGGSTRTKTAIKCSSDLDLNVRTSERLSRADRVKFKDALVALLPVCTDGWRFVHMGKKCMKLEKLEKAPKLQSRQVREVDIAFMNTTFEWSVVDRAENVAFFEDNQIAQRAVKVFKFCFLDVSGLCGFHVERLAVAVCGKGQLDLSAKVLFERMLENLCGNGAGLRKVAREALEEGLNEEDVDNLEEQVERQICKKNVCKNAGCCSDQELPT